MKRLCLILAILLPALLLLAQPLTLNDVVWGSRRQFAPNDIPGIRYWWVSEDIATGQVTNWIDRIYNSSLTNGAAATRPTNTSTGVNFYRASSTVLTNIGIELGNDTNTTHFFVLSLNSGSVFQAILGRTDAVAGEIGFNTANNLYVYSAPVLVADGTVTVGTWYSLMIVSSASLHGLVFYTNGVPESTNTSLEIYGWNWGQVGNGVSGYLDANVREIAVWTNTAVTSAEAFNLHRYATNKYGF